jgi:hypothetical protein
MTIPPKIASEFELTQEQVMHRVLEDFGDAATYYAQAFQRMANDKRLHPSIRDYARRTIENANSIIGYG